jgi:5'-3' exonuclease
MDYILIDANNLACKAEHAYGTETTSGLDTALIYGFLDQLVSLRQDFKEFYPLVVWDAGHVNRDAVSRVGVERGLVKEAYKENRDSVDSFKPDSNQIKQLQEFISCTNIPQIRIKGREADDVIASYCELLKGPSDNTIACFTSDKDYYQIIDRNVSVIRRMQGDQTIWNLSKFRKEFEIEPPQWVDVGALEGDKGDNIFGVPGVGKKFALQYVQEYGTAIAAVDAMTNKLAALRAEFPDIDNLDDLEELRSKETATGSQVYECVYMNMPFTGVALASERKQIKKCKKIEIKMAMYKERVKLAYELKEMDRQIPVPPLTALDRFNEKKLLDLCDLYEFNEVRERLDLFRELPS